MNVAESFLHRKTPFEIVAVFKTLHLGLCIIEKKQSKQEHQISDCRSALHNLARSGTARSGCVTASYN